VGFYSSERSRIEEEANEVYRYDNRFPFAPVGDALARQGEREG
jgi:hypothetical protein